MSFTPPDKSPERFRRLIDIVGEALDVRASEREAFLVDRCADDAALLAEARALLADAPDEQPEGGVDELTTRLDTHIARAAAATVDAHDPTSRVGERVGAYRLISEISRGGMGTVYLGERADDEYRARVAIKVVRGRLAAPDIAQRFRAERQILADLNHPMIARLLDGGTTRDGTPYLVMEYIEGKPLDVWCDEHTLDVRARIGLVASICDAVDYAHGRGVIHRDIKPSNILVTVDGAPKLVDFGIAKLSMDDGAADATPTVRVLTPSYASPEQVRGDVSTAATDVYALGAVLYELLAGRPPFDLRRASAAEIERVVCHSKPSSPSTAAAKHEPVWRNEVAAMDDIVLRALRKDPRERYATVREFASALQGHLHERSVTGVALLARRVRAFGRQPHVLAAIALLVVASAFGVFMAAGGGNTRVPRIRGFALAPLVQADSSMPAPFVVRTADFNGDGRADLVWNHKSDSANHIRVALAKSDGSLTLQPLIVLSQPPDSARLREMMIGDFTGDGLDDLAWQGFYARGLSTMLIAASLGDGTFRFYEPARLATFWNGSWKGYVYDFNDDGRDDIVFNSLGLENVVRVVTSNGDGTFKVGNAVVHIAQRWNRYVAHLGDVDGNGKPDFIWNDAPDGMNRVYIARSLNVVTPMPWQDHPDAVEQYLAPERSRWAGFDTHVGDVNGDRRADIIWIAANRDSVLVERAFGLATGQFRFEEPQTLTRPPGAGRFTTHAGDFNGDSRMDVVLLDRGANRAWVALGTSSGGFVLHDAPFTGGSAFPRAASVLIADVNGDGRADIVTTGADHARVAITR